ncbi:tail fiber protein [Xenorhabdus szentirmaii]|uniref:Tail fiber protein (Modular protein) n=1 Tax=Xenorhabdus szentirmaii DSM 16338 TaxID=1427518 RepID=W1J7I1_9GAMM|nr:phage tail protein [Xenorhabdus szentirmaii]PHM32019.1 tail fiber protein [Xenorhabdus szentirmaii DSM 16338]CDL85425.1 Putative tail fiber protein (modular protein) [Xenorhabdus szentirmaii DSM 16338]
MAKNEFLPFGLADGANVLSNEEYGKLAARTNGFSSGVAKSQELNKVWRQASVIMSVVAQFIAETTGKDVLDDGNLAALQAGLLNALRATVSANVPSASLNVAGITKLSNEVNSNAENVAATSKAVKQVADALNTKQDKGDYATNAALNGVRDLANGRLEKAKNGADIPDRKAFVNNIGALPITGGRLTGKLFVDGTNGRDADIDAKGWIWGKDLFERHDNGKWAQVYSEKHPPTAAVVGAYSITESNSRFALKKSHEPFSCGGVDVEATHDWAGIKLKNANGYYVQMSANPHDKPDMLTIYYRDSATQTQHYVGIPKKTGMVALTEQLLGINQQWTDVTSSRENGKWYINDTGKPIVVYVECAQTNANTGPFSLGGEVDNHRVGYFWVTANSIYSTSFIVPPGSRYTVKAGWGTKWGEGIKEGAIVRWVELR